jgi:hypothetical protein
MRNRIAAIALMALALAGPAMADPPPDQGTSPCGAGCKCVYCPPPPTIIAPFAPMTLAAALDELKKAIGLR